MKRLQKLDILRGILILVMILFHTNFILNNIYLFNTNLSPIFLKIIQIIGASLFISIAGISFSIAEKKYQNKIGTFYFKRFIFLSIIAILITIITYFFNKNQLIVFGILHFFAVAFLLILFFRKFKLYNIVVGFLFIFLGVVISNNVFNIKYLFWLGFTFPGFSSADYYPIFPWFGAFLIGYTFGLFSIKKDLLEKIFGGNLRYTFWLEFLGKNSLVIYLIHAPIIYGILYLVFSII